MKCIRSVEKAGSSLITPAAHSGRLFLQLNAANQGRAQCVSDVL